MVISEIIGTISGALGIGKFLKGKFSPEPTVQYVHLKYPEDSGLKDDLEAKGFELSWCDERKLQIKLEQEGVSNVFKSPKDGKPVILKVKTEPRDLVLLSSKRT